MPGFRDPLLPFWRMGRTPNFVPKIRYAIVLCPVIRRVATSVSRKSPQRSISGCQDRWFVTLYPSYDIRINYGDPNLRPDWSAFPAVRRCHRSQGDRRRSDIAGGRRAGHQGLSVQLRTELKLTVNLKICHVAPFFPTYFTGRSRRWGQVRLYAVSLFVQTAALAVLLWQGAPLYPTQPCRVLKTAKRKNRF